VDQHSFPRWNMSSIILTHDLVKGNNVTRDSMTSLAEHCLRVIHHTSHSRVAGLSDSNEWRKVSSTCMRPTCLNVTAWHVVQTLRRTAVDLCWVGTAVSTFPGAYILTPWPLSAQSSTVPQYVSSSSQLAQPRTVYNVQQWVTTK
jgi:hypothetical protein